eukprot:5101142-Pyramimonas_sp.AAC.1
MRFAVRAPAFSARKEQGGRPERIQCLPFTEAPWSYGQVETHIKAQREKNKDACLAALKSAWPK